MATRNCANIDSDALIKELDNVEALSDRVRIAGYGLASPLLKMRAAQMRREVKRVATQKGEDHPEVAARTASLQRTEARLAQFNEELSRARLDQPGLSEEKTAGVYGRVAAAGKPLANMTVIVNAHNERVDYVCTGENGAFAMVVPAEQEIILSVRTADGEEVYRDPAATLLQPGEQRFREIDLTRDHGTPCPEPHGTTPSGQVVMVNLVGQTEAAARRIITSLGLTLGKLGERVVEEGAGLVLEQDPEEGAVLQRGDVVSIVVGASNLVMVPDLMGLLLKEARKLLESKGLKLGEVGKAPARPDQEGRVVNQDPAFGRQVSRGGEVVLEIGEVNEVIVPNLIGSTQEQGEKTLKKAQLLLGDVKTVPAAAEKVGLIIDQSPLGGVWVAPGEAVRISVGRLEEITVPNLIGRKQDEGIEMLHAVGATLGEVSATPVDGERVGLIVNQNPPAGRKALRGTAVSIVVGRKNEVIVPQLVGRSEREAAQLIKRAGLKAGKVTKEPVASNQAGRILAQEPKAGAKVEPGSTVDIVLGAAGENVVVPNLVGKKMEEASRMLEAKGLRPGRIIQVPDLRGRDGLVLKQDPQGGARVAPGSRVSLQVGTRREIDLNTVAKRAEEIMRERGVLREEEAGLVARSLETAGIRNVEQLRELLTLSLREIHARLKLRNQNITRSVISALKTAIGSR